MSFGSEEIEMTKRNCPCCVLLLPHNQCNQNAIININSCVYGLVVRVCVRVDAAEVRAEQKNDEK